MGPIEEAEEAGIPMVTLDTAIDHPNILSLIGVEQYDTSREFGRYVAGYIAGQMGGEAKVGLMIASSEVQIARRDGFVDALTSTLPGAEVVAEGDGRNILERATAEAENMLTANPDINVIYATGDPQLQGALTAGLSQNRDIAFFGWDDIPAPFLQPLEEGRLVGFLAQSSDFNGEQGVRLLVQHLNGESISSRVSYVPSIVTPFNLDDFR
jgi:ABC-type sugar transport system substrate-binding protein